MTYLHMSIKRVGVPSLPSALAFEAVADSANGQNHQRVAGVVLQLLAQPADIDIHGTVIAVIFVSPDVFEDTVARENRALVAHHIGEQVEETRVEVDQFSAFGDLATV